jgi:aspartate 1-decarboxylase
VERTMLKSKIHRATITATEIYYDSSITLDQDLLDEADILPGEQVQVLNLNNGARFTTYAIAAERGSGIVMLNGPAARLGAIGDEVIVLSYCQVSDEEAGRLELIMVNVDKDNKVHPH